MKQVEQVLNNEIIIDYDELLSKNKILDILKESFEVVSNKNPYEINFKNIQLKFFVKQVTYLGNPHLIFKKRIQISKGWSEELKEENSFLIGLYKYKNEILYVFFDKSNFINRTTNNSSAHISTFDLLNASKEGIFTKKDIRNNIITVLRKDKLINFIEKLIGKENVISDEILLFENFKNKLAVNYFGINCYQEMITNNYRTKFQPEWVGFYLEFKFEEYLELNPNLKKICNFQSKKKDGEIDLDLNFNNEFLGDLKAHSNDSNGILGNDKKNIENTLKIYGKFWYIVFNHDTTKDQEKDFEVTKYWNTEINKTNPKKIKNLMSYAPKMKHSIAFTDFKILEINNYNKQYIADFNQGKNNNGKVRNVKIKINKKTINNFLIYTSNF